MSSLPLIRTLLISLFLAIPIASCATSGSSFDEDFANDGKSEQDGLGGSGGSGPGDVSVDYCGNGVIDGGEECDGMLLGGATCQTLGFSGGGALNCDPETCTYDESMCIRPPGQNPPTGGRGG